MSIEHKNWHKIFSDDETSTSTTTAAICPSCQLAYNTGQRRMLVDSCGHQRCYQCMFTTSSCPQCAQSSVHSPAMSVRSLSGRPSMSMSSCPGIQSPVYGKAMTPSPGVVRRPGYRPSPGPGARRHNWIQRHNRRPTTVNIDDNTMSGNIIDTPSANNMSCYSL